MKSKRIVKGNFTTIPTGSDLLGEYYTNAVISSTGSIEESAQIKNEKVIASREFANENQK